MHFWRLRLVWNYFLLVISRQNFILTDSYISPFRQMLRICIIVQLARLSKIWSIDFPTANPSVAGCARHPPPSMQQQPSLPPQPFSQLDIVVVVVVVVIIDIVADVSNFLRAATGIATRGAVVGRRLDVARLENIEAASQPANRSAKLAS